MTAAIVAAKHEPKNGPLKQLQVVILIVINTWQAVVIKLALLDFSLFIKQQLWPEYH